jgi:hypothetical protein
LRDEPSPPASAGAKARPKAEPAPEARKLSVPEFLAERDARRAAGG